MTRAFAFGPQTLFGTREEGHFAGFLSDRQCFLIHIPHHQNFAGYGMLNDGWHQVIDFFPIQLVDLLFC
ncbi:hypothetical protein YPPY13_1855 [Yersinia pestis PY-13]|nr:hypothetical protein YPPY11_1930 [Yersinia pestis PY-11]EIR48010.1 hypothetical protein YPPY13_1855 [Yersinia pestis PY-13]EIS06755.1 hypothetical protein YPPY47_1922 [Yersinia pestis PY-47]EIT60114.1 hypothetical protein YPPY103_1941 [Yersinia pestis PY-103]